MSKQTNNMNTVVTVFLDLLNHPFRIQIEELRVCILAADANLSENLKWNGPNYCFYNQDVITMKIHPPNKPIQLIFHRGAKKRKQPNDKLIDNKSTLLVWKENDRAVITFKNMQEIENGKAELLTIIREWITASRGHLPNTVAD